MVSNEIASCISISSEGKTTLVLHNMYKCRNIKLTHDDETLLLAVFTEIVKPKIGGVVEND